MVEMFKRCNFLLHVAYKQDYEEGFRFTENNIITYLAELEEYICALITYTAWKLNAPNHAISFIPIEALTVKDFERKEITVSLPPFKLFRYKHRTCLRGRRRFNKLSKRPTSMGRCTNCLNPMSSRRKL